MKGIVFASLNKLVEEKFGFHAWEMVLEDSKPASEGIYTAAENYPDEEIFSLVGSLSKTTGIPIPALVTTFGEFLFGEFARLSPEYFQNRDAKSFLQSVHGIIHIEVKKLHPDAQLPTFSYEDPAPNRLVMLYRSPRKLCPLAEGLIRGTAKHFHVKIDLNHPLCLHRGDDHCRLELTFS